MTDHDHDHSADLVAALGRSLSELGKRNAGSTVSTEMIEYALGRFGISIPAVREDEPRPRVRVTLKKAAHLAWNGRTVEARTEVKEFDDPAEAANWFIHDSYFSESYTISALWENLKIEPWGNRDE